MSDRTRSGSRGRQLLGGLLAVGVAVAVVAVGCQSADRGQAAPEGGGGVAPTGTGSVLRLVGSNTIGSGLAPDLAEGWLVGQGATDVRRESRAGLVTVTGTPTGRSEPVSVEIRAEGTETAFDALREGTADIAMASRRILPAEVAELAGRGDLTARAAEHVVALDAVAVIVPRANPVTALSIDQLRGVFTCAITDWSQVGGSPGPIRVLARDANSGTFEAFRDAVLGGQALCPSAQLFADSTQLSDAAAADPSAIGFVGLPFVGTNHALELSDGAAPRVGPTALSVSTETYLLTRRLYLYLPTLPVDDPLARQFVETYAQGPGQAVVARAGFVSPYATPEPQPQTCSGDLPEYCAVTGGAERVPFDVRFATGTDQVDNRAFRNLDLLAGALAGPGGADRQVLLVGFADNAGDDAANLALSRQRAEAVRTYLAGHGITSALTAGFGEALPVDTNDTPEGREQNRRVEVWVR